MTTLEEKVNTDLAQKRLQDNLNLPKHIAKKLEIGQPLPSEQSTSNVCSTQLDSNNIILTNKKSISNNMFHQ
jgi:hypothetical protein